MPRIRTAVALATALVALCPTVALPKPALRLDPAPQWREARNMQELMAILDDWLDVNSEWAQRTSTPLIRRVSEWEARARRGTTSSLQRGPLRGLYDPDTQEILLIEPWDPRNTEDVSTLLHEMIHHRQAPHHWYCPAAQELPAYRLQEAWLGERGLQAEVNWVAVVLDAGCTSRDIHPD
ncbi:DUF6647 family protein [Tranquillimonas alkanivorans]|uniref:DUF6647 domain-containing protein n=1 Tax=Tranquillimonas alkanivorans TaxID=441119 RepID=A0A1I5VM27_9RHOB|nr:DUF6647 family protein [Tranquillimonas alkanivorans]SFQ08036.1 hypothetical protein SAMN04488047_13224 [Tranquillimonas alkanivorans]